MVIKNTRTNHWTQLVPEEQIRFWEDYEAGRATSFLVEPERNRTKRRRGEHSTKPKCEIRPGIVLRAIRR